MLKPIPTAGPISATIGNPLVLPRNTGVLPAGPHELVAGLNSSAAVPFWTSTVNTCPFGSNVQPSSLLGSALPTDPMVQVTVVPGIAAMVATANWEPAAPAWGPL